MKDEVHLTPEQFVDLLDGAPLAAERRKHLAGCIACRLELEELEETLGMVRAEARGVRGVRRRVAWAAAAAAVVAAAALLFRSSPVNEPTPETAEIEILAPLEEDPDYRILEAFSQQIPDEDALAPSLTDFPDASELTPAELRDFAERLAQEVSSTS